MFQKWNTRMAARKGGPFGQIAKAFCRPRQLNRNPAHDASHSGSCGCQRGASSQIGKTARLVGNFARTGFGSSGNGNSGTKLPGSPG